ncbi:hypothetical protein ANN_04262 [Periplaneta americana]|uniref:Uncharacterized protein n=1 Tax=Periplaneta americana TaxID=6978 RepID=A0ABQ8T8U6_PERAM|nr:hypothetical protein ANN_04262 [Periplaneta americana]
MAGLCEGGNEPPGSLKANAKEMRHRDEVTHALSSADISTYWLPSKRPRPKFPDSGDLVPPAIENVKDLTRLVEQCENTNVNSDNRFLRIGNVAASIKMAGSVLLVFQKDVYIMEENYKLKSDDLPNITFIIQKLQDLRHFYSWKFKLHMSKDKTEGYVPKTIEEEQEKENLLKDTSNGYLKLQQNVYSAELGYDIFNRQHKKPGVMVFYDFYSLYHQLPKNARELRQHAEQLEIELLKIGRFLGSKWVALIFRSVSTVWKNFNALVAHFTAVKDDRKRDSADRNMYEKLLMYVIKVDFILDLALMCDALQESSKLSLELQSRDVTLYSAHRKIKTQVMVFEKRNFNHGLHYSEVPKAEERLNFKGIDLQEVSRGCRLDPYKFYNYLKQRMENRLLRAENIGIPECAEVLDCSTLPDSLILELHMVKQT